MHIVSAVRTPFGTFGGALKDHSATALGVIAAKEAIARSGVTAAQIDHAVFGNVLQTSGDACYLARHIALAAGCRDETPALTVNRLCGSGFEAIIQGERELRLGEDQIALVGGTESMSQAPFVARGIRWGLGLGANPPLIDSLTEALRDAYGGCTMAETAENVAQEYGITREACDAFGLRSQQLTSAGVRDGWYDDEIVPVPVTRKRGAPPEMMTRDEHPRPATTAEALAALRPIVRADGVVTAGTASGIGDGAAALVLASDAAVAAYDLRPLARVVAWGIAGVAPRVMGIGPVPAIKQAFMRSGLSMEMMDLVEINEAFAAQTLAVEQLLGIPRDKLNVHGGAIALSHPLGASGARIVAHLVHALRRSGGRYGLGAACVGGGQGICVIVESSTRGAREGHERARGE